jgi:hypothetical protein
MRWAEHVARIGRKMNNKFVSEKLKEKDYVRGLGINERITLSRDLSD